jgi:hypothetical protein
MVVVAGVWAAWAVWAEWICNARNQARHPDEIQGGRLTIRQCTDLVGVWF